jgi:hypothetical protein
LITTSLNILDSYIVIDVTQHTEISCETIVKFDKPLSIVYYAAELLTLNSDGIQRASTVLIRQYSAICGALQPKRSPTNGAQNSSKFNNYAYHVARQHSGIIQVHLTYTGIL